MSTIVVTMWTTLDGFVAGPDDEMDWLRFDDDLQAYEADLIATADTLLLGRVTFNDFAGHWPRSSLGHKRRDRTGGADVSVTDARTLKET